MNESKQSRLVQLTALARRVVEDDNEADRWLIQPQSGLGNRRAIDLIGSELGYQQVENLLLRIEYGVYS